MLFLVVFAALIICYYVVNNFAHAVQMDVKCTIYEHSDDVNGNNVDVRILVMGLEKNQEYRANVVPEHNPPTNVTTKSDSDGIFWAIAKIPNGEKSLQFDVSLYKGNDEDGVVIASGNDDAPCHQIPSTSR